MIKRYLRFNQGFIKRHWAFMKWFIRFMKDFVVVPIGIMSIIIHTYNYWR